MGSGAFRVKKMNLEKFDESNGPGELFKAKKSILLFNPKPSLLRGECPSHTGFDSCG